MSMTMSITSIIFKFSDRCTLTSQQIYCKNFTDWNWQRVYKTRRPYRSPTRRTLLCLEPQYKIPQLDRDKTKLWCLTYTPVWHVWTQHPISYWIDINTILVNNSSIPAYLVLIAKTIQNLKLRNFFRCIMAPLIDRKYLIIPLELRRVPSSEIKSKHLVSVRSTCDQNLSTGKKEHKNVNSLFTSFTIEL